MGTIQPVAHIRITNVTRLASMAVGLLVLSGCATRVGPRTIPAARFDYNKTIARSLDEQLLLNLVRPRYRDTPLFVDIGGVVAQYTVSGEVSASPVLQKLGGDKNEYGFGLSGSFSERPTITYEPLKGEEFAQRLLSPISPVTLILLSHSGWSIERLLLCCVQQINDLRNAPSATGPTPSYVPENEEFLELADLLRKTQVAGVPTFRLSHVKEKAEVFVQIPKRDGAGSWESETGVLRRLLNLSDEVDTFRLTSDKLRRSADEISMTGRSLLGVLFFLSQSVETPEEHERQGLVTITENEQGERFDWRRVTGGLLGIRSQASQPDGAFVRINYRDHWFYIADRDLESKTTFNLLAVLFSLQAARGRGVTPLLTLPIGN